MCMTESTITVICKRLKEKTINLQFTIKEQSFSKSINHEVLGQCPNKGYVSELFFVQESDHDPFDTKHKSKQIRSPHKDFRERNFRLECMSFRMI